MQTSYNVEPIAGVVGAIAESGSKTVRARVAGGTVRPGQYVVLSGLTCGHPSAAPTPQTRGGVAVRNPYKQGDGVFAAGEMLDVLVEGAIWIATEDAVSVNTPAFVRHVAAGAEQLGAFRSNADTADATHIPGLYFRSAGTTLVKLEVNKSAYVAP
jgi:hypothetical protein